MPIDEIEYHPYLVVGEAVAKPGGLILGSFPVYACTDFDSGRKQELRVQNGSVRFFYGSSANYFWEWYRDYVDKTVSIEPIDSAELLASLSQRGIAISDVISECWRKKESFLDSDLRDCQWNSAGIINLINQEVSRIMCTSKGVMSMLFSKVLKVHSDRSAFAEDAGRSTIASRDFVNAIDGDTAMIAKPVCRVFTIKKTKRTIEVLAIPSPGSPFRKLPDFGWPQQSTSWEYLDRYLKQSFSWIAG